ncbi:MAG: ATP-dependent DNA ligase [Actinomycetota bacterium]|nr:ATP-dependent DNA ligase [Actinomycetota bacterium]
MALPLKPPIEPQLARSKPELPLGECWAYEPKYDGFRALAFVDGDRWVIQSRAGKPLERYFPELSFPAGRYVLDGEIVIDDDGEGDGGGNGGRGGAGQDFAALQQRIHPAQSRIALLAEQTPARYVAFDLLARGDDSLLDAPFAQRRATLEALLSGGPIEVTRSTLVAAQAEPWLRSGEGVVAKDVGAAYHPGQRTGMVKIKRLRTIDAVLAGYRPGKEPGTVGSLILGLYDAAGELHVVGHSSGLRAAEKRALWDTLAPYETGTRGHGDPSRWKSEKELEWIELRPELVVEVTFDHASGGRIRHGTKILRWREDKAPRECALAQMDS